MFWSAVLISDKSLWSVFNWGSDYMYYSFSISLQMNIHLKNQRWVLSIIIMIKIYLITN